MIENINIQVHANNGANTVLKFSVPDQCYLQLLILSRNLKLNQSDDSEFRIALAKSNQFPAGLITQNYGSIFFFDGYFCNIATSGSSIDRLRSESNLYNCLVENGEVYLCVYHNLSALGVDVSVDLYYSREMM